MINYDKQVVYSYHICAPDKKCAITCIEQSCDHMANVQRVKLVVILIRNVRQIVLENRACIHSDDCATEECCNSDDKCGRLQCRIKVYSWLDCCSDCYQCYCCYHHTYCMQLSCFAVVVRPHRQQPRDILLMVVL